MDDIAIKLAKLSKPVVKPGYGATKGSVFYREASGFISWIATAKTAEEALGKVRVHKESTRAPNYVLRLYIK